MGKRPIEVTVEPRVLIWARESIGKSLEDVILKFPEIGAWETGEKKPTLSKLKRLGIFYKRPLATFLLPEPPIEKPKPTDFRTLPLDSSRDLTTKTLLAIRRARFIQGIAEFTGAELGLKTFSESFNIKFEGDITNLAKTVRKELGVTAKAQYRWKDEYEALKEWILYLEKISVITIRQNFPIEEGRAFCLTSKNFPIIVLNNNDWQKGKIFSLIHEFGHVISMDDGICNMVYPNNVDRDLVKKEVEFNHFAGNVLVPAEMLNEVSKNLGTEWYYDEDNIKFISSKFRVSTEVILRRLLTLRIISEQYYAEKREEILESLKSVPKPTFPVPYETRVINSNGRLFTNLVINARNEGLITFSDVSDYLKIKLKHFPKIEKKLFEEGYFG